MSASKVLLANSADIEARSQNGETPIFTAARNGHEDIVKFLLQKGADKKAEANGGLTPLQVATLNGHQAVVSVLRSFRS